ncbi:hypothetical protein [Demequina aurantiaca]|uniref:hypothetical protein n=1 Tax=Demequina aurantiaca TaxID=676200 RepID=UPI003D3351A3
MIRLLIRAAIYVGSAALAVWVTSLILADDMSVPLTALLYIAVIFAVIQAILSPFIFKMTRRYANAFIGGVGLLSTYVSLLITTFLVSGFQISGVSTWIAATVLIWLITALATWLLPLWLLKEHMDKRDQGLN